MVYATCIFVCVAALIYQGNAQIDYIYLEGDVRLVNGEVASEGRVEIFHGGRWGTVCDDQWDLTDAEVVCRQLGYPHAVAAPGRAFFGEDAGSLELPIHLDDVSCSGFEETLSQCPSEPWGFNDCTHAEDAGVICEITEYTENGTVRLVGGSSDLEGRVEIYFGSEWGTVCDDFWDMHDAAVVCRQLGFERAVGAIGQAYFGPGHEYQTIYLDNVHCNGSEARLALCGNRGIGVNDCSHFEDAGVICSNAEEGAEGQVRLSDGSTADEGRVEIYHDYHWGTVCDDDWNVDDATVVCRQLGYERAVEAPTHAHFGPGKDGMPIFMDQVQCTGREAYLSTCSFDGWGNTDCTHVEDAGAVCTNDAAVMPVWVLGIIIVMSIMILVLCVSVFLSLRSSKRSRGASTVFSVSGSPLTSTSPSSAQPPSDGDPYEGSFGYLPLEQAPPRYEGEVATAKPFWVPYSYLNPQAVSLEGNSNEVSEDA